MRIMVLSLVVAAMLFAPSAQASTIVYNGELHLGSTVSGSIAQPNNSPDTPLGAEFWSFTANAGDSVEIVGDRLSAGYDMYFWVLKGTFSDTNEFLQNQFSTNPSLIVATGDDQDAPNLPGPFGDPHVIFTAPVTGTYSVAVTNFFSDGTGPFSYALTYGPPQGAISTPEPASLALLGAGAVGLAATALRRRRRRRAT